MKLNLQSDNKPFIKDLSGETSEHSKTVESHPDSRIYLDLSPDQHEGMPRRHQGELIMRNGWVHLDYDREGFLIGLEFVEGDPFTGVTEAIRYLQPVNPLVQ